MTPETIQRHNKMILTCIKSAQKMIEPLRVEILDPDAEESEQQEFITSIQDFLDYAAGLLLTLRNAGAAIEQAVMDAFNELNRNVRELHAELNVGLLPREIGDVPEPAGHEEQQPVQVAAANDTDCDAILCVVGALQEAKLDCPSDDES